MQPTTRRLEPRHHLPLLLALTLTLGCGTAVPPLLPDGGRADAGQQASTQDAGCPGMELRDGGCLALSLARVCAVSHLVVLHSGVAADDAASTSMAAALGARCAPATDVVVVDTRDAGGGVLDPTGAPLPGRDQTLVAAGGSFTQPFISWYETSGSAPVRDSSSGGLASISTRAGEALFSVPMASLGPHLDYFVIEFVRGSPFAPLAVIGYGFYGPGTTAAAWYFEHRVLATPATYPGAWYVTRWSDTDGNGLPGEADDFTAVRSGP